MAVLPSENKPGIINEPFFGEEKMFLYGFVFEMRVTEGGRTKSIHNLGGALGKTNRTKIKSRVLRKLYKIGYL